MPSRRHIPFLRLLAIAALALLPAACRTAVQPPAAETRWLRPEGMAALPLPPLHAEASPCPAYNDLLGRTFASVQTEAPADDARLRECPLPPSPAQLSIPLSFYREGTLLLLKGYNAEAVSTADLDALLQAHLLQEQVARIYHAAERLQHGKDEALPLLVAAVRKLDTLCRQQDVPADAVAGRLNACLSDWRALWEGLQPAGVLPSLWLLTGGEAAQWPLMLTKETPLVHFSAGYVELPMQLPDLKTLNPPAQDGFVCLRQRFVRPDASSGQELCLVCPPLPPDTEICLNGTALPLERFGGKAACIPLGGILHAELMMQEISVRLPAAEAGRAMLPLCLGLRNNGPLP